MIARGNLTLGGLLSVFGIVSMAMGAVTYAENRYSTQGELRALRCDVYLLHLRVLESRAAKDSDINNQMKKAINLRWERLCANSGDAVDSGRL